MTTISAGAAAGLLVALMVLATGAERLPAVRQIKGLLPPGDTEGFNPQPELPLSGRKPAER